jgi:nucleoside-diphosphate-sugar epimerase
LKIGILGTGFIGQSLAQFLHENNFDVLSLSRTKRDFPWRHITDLDSFKEISHDLDSIIVASGLSRPNQGNLQLEEQSTLSLLSEFQINSSLQIFYLSSGSVYGECDNAKSESDLATPTTEYGEAKLQIENRLLKNYGDQVLNLRIGNVLNFTNPYGIIAQVRKKLTENKTIHLNGYPDSTRDYIIIEDFCKVISTLLTSRFIGSVLNIGSGTSTNLRDIFQLIKNNDEFKGEVLWSPPRQGDLRKTILDVQKMRNFTLCNPANPIKALSGYLLN